MKITFLCFILFTALSLLAQDPEHTQFFSSPLYLNPAYAGSAGCSRINLNYRNQWPNLSGSFVTYYASYDQFVNPIRGGIGGYIMHDNAGEGTINSTFVSIPYSFPIKFNDQIILRLGVATGLKYKKVDWSKLRFGDQIDPRRGWVYQTQELSDKPSKIFPDFATGFVLQLYNVSIGYAIDHLFEPNESFFGSTIARLPRKHTFHTSIHFHDQLFKYGLTPQLLFQKQEDFNQINIGLQARYGKFSTGFFYRNSDAMIVNSGFEFHHCKVGSFKISYSYDFTISKLGNPKDGTHGGHEFALQYKFNCKNKTDKFPALDDYALRKKKEENTESR